MRSEEGGGHREVRRDYGRVRGKSESKDCVRELENYREARRENVAGKVRVAVRYTLHTPEGLTERH